MRLSATSAVFRFEFARAATPTRLAYWVGLALFPPALLTIIRIQIGPFYHFSQTTLMLFVLIPEVLCLMGLLLWATPAIHAELEGRTWCYLAVRSGGKGSVLMGKYLAAVVWTALLALLSLTLSVLIAAPPGNMLRLWTVFAVLIVLSCLTYGALCMLLAVVFLRRAMVAMVAYSVIFELVVGFIPAIINQLTVQYHLRSLLDEWLHVRILPRSMQTPLQSAPAWQHLLILAGATLALLTATIVILRKRELVRADEA